MCEERGGLASTIRNTSSPTGRPRTDSLRTRRRPSCRRRMVISGSGPTTAWFAPTAWRLRGLLRLSGRGGAPLRPPDRPRRHLAQQHADEIDLLVLDVVMPSLGGREALDQMRQRRPAIPALFCSGYAPQPSQPDVAAEPELRHPVIQKPYAPSELLRRVRAILEASRPAI